MRRRRRRGEECSTFKWGERWEGRRTRRRENTQDVGEKEAGDVGKMRHSNGEMIEDEM